jgi:hypothetical protein
MKETISAGTAIALKENQTKCLSISASGASCQQIGEERGYLNSVSHTNRTFDQTQRKDNLSPFISIAIGLTTNTAEFPQRGTNLPTPHDP